MHKTLHPRDDLDRAYASRKEEGRGLAIILDSADGSIQQLEDYLKTCRNTNYCYQKQYWQHKHQKNNNQKTKMGRKITERTFQTTN